MTYSTLGKDVQFCVPTLKGCPIEALAAFLVQFFGGPCEYAPRRWSLSLREAHLRFPRLQLKRARRK